MNEVAKSQAGSSLKMDRRKHIRTRLQQDRYLYLLILPGILFVLVFSYFPMYGLVLAFKNYQPRMGIMGSEWVGWDNFKFFFERRDAAYTILNTLRIGFLNLLFGFPVPIILALLLNELRSRTFRRGIQITIYLPYFISWVVVYGLLYGFLSTNTGVFNQFLGIFGLNPVDVLGDPNKFRPMLYLTNIWKGAGWGTIIYMAAIAGVDQEMYDAARLDGASRFQQILFITLPAISFSITTMLILNAGSIMSANFDQIMNLRRAPTMRVSQVIDTYVYDLGVSKLQYGISTAVGLFQQVVNFILLFTTNRIVNRMNGQGFF